ncbi:MAG TPA: alpha/beta hydrolase [Steroidobacteraceae bacterium]|jgi:pimeloyl-ACP methyl ester carboxylesterase|nr:alpha/beta hydrolase [Steroidobacteraceae bacterium]
MPITSIDGITTRYEIRGSGPPLLLFSPGGFDATIEAWALRGAYAQTKPLEHLSRQYTCIVFDRRESGASGGRVEHITWSHYVVQGKGLLQHLGIERAHLMGGCMGCSPVLAFAVAHPESVISMVLYWPAGGPKYRLSSRQRFAEHLAYAHREGLAAVVALARESGKAFGTDPRVGPWAAVIRGDPQFAAGYAAQDLAAYELIVAGMERSLIDRDTTPGAEPEELMRLDLPALIIPGHDHSHATSAARYLEECLPRAEYWDTVVAEQTEARTSARILEFLAAASSR